MSKLKFLDRFPAKTFPDNKVIAVASETLANVSSDGPELMHLARTMPFPEDVIDKILDSGSTNIRASVSLNPHASNANLKKALSDRIFHVRESAATHGYIDKENLQTALNDSGYCSHYVRNAAMQNPNYKKYFPNGH